MSYPATQALAHFEMHKDDERAQALQSFILLTLGKPLIQVLSWDITQGANEDVATFRMELTNGSQLEGRLHRQERPELAYRLLRAGESAYRWGVGDDWRYTF